MIIEMLLSVMIGVALGSVPFGLLFAKIYGLPDPRYIGSGNIGATNILRSGRKDVAALTLLCDGLKAVAAVLIAEILSPAHGSFALLGAILGHVFCPWLSFKGGKGVACAIGGLFAMAPLTGLITSSLWLTVFFSTRISSLSALISLLFAPFILWWETHAVNAIVLMLVVGLIMYRHKDNIDRLIRAKEPQFTFNNKSKRDGDHV